MRGSIPGTTHSTTLHRDEPAILAIVEAHVKKLKAGRIENTKSSRLKLQLRPSVMEGKTGSIVGGWLHIGGGKRLLTLYTAAGVTLDALRDELEAALAGFSVPVEVFNSNCPGGHGSRDQKPNGENSMAIEMQTSGFVQASIPDKDHLLAVCDLITDLMLQARALKPTQEHLRAELEAVSAEVEQAQNDALSLLAQINPELPKDL